MPLVFFWLLGVTITGFVFKVVFTQIVGLILITFIIYFILKLYISINIFMQNLAIFLGMSCICFLGFYPYLYFTVLCFFAIILLICIFVNLFHVFRQIVNLFIFYLHVQLMLILTDITHTVRLQSNVTSLELWVTFPVKLLFLLVWGKQKSD